MNHFKLWKDGTHVVMDVDGEKVEFGSGAIERLRHPAEQGCCKSIPNQSTCEIEVGAVLRQLDVNNEP